MLNARKVCVSAFLLVFAAQPIFADRVIEKYDDGKTKLDYQVNEEGVKHGGYKAFHPNGRVKVSARYKDGGIHGLYSEYNEEGRLIAKGIFRDGKKNGEYRYYDDRGRIARSMRYIDGVQHGIEKRFDNGKLVQELRWNHGDLLLNGESRDELLAKLKEINTLEVKGPGTKDMKDFVRRLMAYRYLCGVPYEDLMLDEEMSAHAEAAARICDALGRMTHKPTENPGLPEEVFEMGRIGCARSNLFMGRDTILPGIDEYMKDSDAHNLPAVGHRRWCLNPVMQKLGVGISGNFSAMWVWDRSRKLVPDWDIVTYPRRGYMPQSYFGDNYAWSISYNVKQFHKVDPDAVKVTVWNAGDKGELDIERTKQREPMKLNHFVTRTGNYGSGPCIIFRPDGVSTRAGSRYWVMVEGLRPLKGGDEPIEYLVEFF